MDNAFIESFNGSFRDECLNVNWFMSLETPGRRQKIGETTANRFRPYSFIGDLTSDEYTEKSRQRVA